MEGKERRKYKRLPIDLKIEVDELFRQDYENITDISATIEVFDISKCGIGFISTERLPLGYYFRGFITLGNGDYFRVVLQIIRESVYDEKRYVYGAEFVGLAPFLADKVDQYEKYLYKE